MFGRFNPDFTVASAYPEIGEHRAALKARDWARARAVYDRGRWELRQLLVNDTYALDGVEEFLRDIVRRDPADTVASTMLGARVVELGFIERTGKRAQYVSDGQFAAFHEHLREAEEILQAVCAADPVNPPAWKERIVIARGLQLGQAEGRRRYDELSRYVPHYLPAEQSLLQNLCPKWGGSLDELHAFARECTQAHRPGAPNPVLTVDAHLEHYLTLKAGSDERLRYFQGEQVREEIRAAGEWSVLNPAFEHSPGWVATVSLFALGYTMIEDWGGAKRCFTQLGAFGDLDDRWLYGRAFGFNARKNFVKAREVALRKG